MKYFNKYGLLNANVGRENRVDENTLMYSMLYMLTTGKGIKEHDGDYAHFLRLCETAPGIYLQRPELGGEDYFPIDRYMSHDQLTSIVAYYSMKGRTDKIQEIYDAFSFMRYDNLNPENPTWMQIQHPRDIFFIRGLLGSWLSEQLCFIITCVELMGTLKLRAKDKSESGFTKFYRTIRRSLKIVNEEQDNVMIETDSKLLAFIRLHAWKSGFKWKVARWIMSKKKETPTFASCFRRYFGKTDHPLHLKHDL